MKYWGLVAVWRPLSLAVVFGVAAVFLWWPLWLAAFVALFDTHARWHEYEEIAELKYSPRLASVLRGSWCRRGVAEATWPEAREFYRQNGYRRYSMFPDGAPFIFIQLRFWEVVFGFRGGRMRGKTPKYILAIGSLISGVRGN